MLVHGTDLAAAEDAVSAAGLRKLTTFDSIGVVVASGLPAQIQAVRASSGVTYVEGNQPIELSWRRPTTPPAATEARAP